MKRLFVLVVALMCLTAQSLWARTIKGSVIDSENEPLIGATIKIDNDASKAVTTDVDGHFFIEAPDKTVTLQVSYIGLKQQTLRIPTSQNEVTVTMSQSSVDLNEVVVVGYGTMKKADLTGSVTNVGGSKIEDMHATSITQALQGQMPGVQVTRSSGLPGASGTIRVRGVTTIGNSDPLVIVDGVPESIESVNSADIESISVLKDAASASIYGARAAAGVILVTTKRAKEGKPKVEYQGSVGFVQATSCPKSADVQTYMRMMNEFQWNESGNQVGQEHQLYDPDIIDNYYELHAEDPDEYPLYDWRKALVRKSAPTTKHDFQVSYGTKQLQSRVSLSYEYSDALYYKRTHYRARQQYLQD